MVACDGALLCPRRAYHSHGFGCVSYGSNSDVKNHRSRQKITSASCCARAQPHPSAIPSVVCKTPSRMALIISCSFLVRYSCTSPRSSASLAERTSHSTVVAEEYLRFCSNCARHEMILSAKPKLSGSNAWRSRRCIAALKVLKNCVATPTCP